MLFHIHVPVPVLDELHDLFFALELLLMPRPLVSLLCKYNEHSHHRPLRLIAHDQQRPAQISIVAQHRNFFESDYISITPSSKPGHDQWHGQM